jgi:excisionase family DNA binding protein
MLDTIRKALVTEAGVRRRLSVEEAATYTGLAVSTLNKYRVTGKPSIPFIKVGRRVTYDSADLDAFLAAHRRTSTSQSTTA